MHYLRKKLLKSPIYMSDYSVVNEDRVEPFYTQNLTLLNSTLQIFGDISMTTFDEREKAFENLYAHDEELRFKVNDVYSNELVNLVASGKDEDSVLNKVQKDTVNKGHCVSKDALSEKYSQLHNEARDHIMSC